MTIFIFHLWMSFNILLQVDLHVMLKNVQHVTEKKNLSPLVQSNPTPQEHQDP